MFASARFARADRSQEIEAVDARAMPVIEIDLQGVVADRMSGARGDLRFKHGKQRRTRRRPRLMGRDCFLLPLIIAHGAWTFFAQIRKAIVAGVTIGPGNIDAGARRHVHLHTGRFSPNIDGYGHRVTILAEAFSESGRTAPHRTCAIAHSKPSLPVAEGSGDSCQTPVFEFDAAVRKISYGL